MLNRLNKIEIKKRNVLIYKIHSLFSFPAKLKQ